MAKTEKEILARSISRIEKWRDGRAINTIQQTFLELQELDQSTHDDLWQQLRQALADNSQLNRDRNTDFLASSSLAAQGYWWWNPDAWTTENEELGMEN